ncbi:MULTISPECIES: DUF5132 domain-containing protein [unclassified Streptomyces]|uniref:DUF5132 domain-containing protein n=1 Tax=unclassified Streptomyces TaxID=2593676 RepID=UPI002E1BB94C|nr:DUF5132 domain-containing protein [Streptomyces sp. NBC_01023]
MPPVVPPFLIGLIVAPLAKRFVTPLVKGVLKTSVGLVMEVKRAAHEANEGLHDLAAEVTTEVMAAQFAAEGATVRAPAPAPAEETAHAVAAEVRTPPKARAGGSEKAR